MLYDLEQQRDFLIGVQIFPHQSLPIKKSPRSRGQLEILQAPSHHEETSGFFSDSEAKWNKPLCRDLRVSCLSHWSWTIWWLNHWVVFQAMLAKLDHLVSFDNCDCDSWKKKHWSKNVKIRWDSNKTYPSAHKVPEKTFGPSIQGPKALQEWWKCWQIMWKTNKKTLKLQH